MIAPFGGVPRAVVPSCAVRNVISDRLSRENDKYQMSSRKDFRIFSLYNILLQKGLATFVWFASRSRRVEIDGLQGLFFEKHGTLFTSTDANHPGGGGGIRRTSEVQQMMCIGRGEARRGNRRVHTSRRGPSTGSVDGVRSRVRRVVPPFAARRSINASPGR